MNKKKFLLLFFTLILFQFSCNSKYNISNEKEFTQHLIENLNEKKVIFIGENHDNVYPVFLISKSLSAFYDSGLRYLFLECGDDGFLFDSNLHEYSFQIVPPWCLYAWKYEMHLLEKEIKKINMIHKSDPIKVYWPEANLQLPDSEKATEILNYRDFFIQKYIKDILDKSNNSEKAIIFYGSGHGAKKPQKYAYNDDSNVQWKMMGYYLSDYYKQDFVSYHIGYLDPNLIKENFNNCVILSGKNYEKFVPVDYRGLYDYECVSSCRIYGVIYPYVYSKDNINALIQKINKFYINSKSEINDKWIYIENLFAIYYLKYWLRDLFCFSYEGEQDLPESIKNITLNNINTIPESSILSLETLETYMEFLYSYDWIEDYLYSPANDKRIDYILYNMKKAKEVNSVDIWPQYWTAYFLTEQAIYSKKRIDFENAIEEWNKLLDNELTYASPVLKLVYEKMALCYNRIGQSKKFSFYKGQAQKVKLDIDYKDYVIFGY